jgi:D-serine deaminase-like pyridoxal phosphate-dependent protein
LRFAGLMTWEGHCWSIDDPDERLAEINKAVGSLVETAEQIRADGIPVEIVSAGGTATYLTSSGISGVTEIQAGGGIFGDLEYLEQGANVKRALSLMTQVTSRPTRDRVIVDAGRKTIDPSNRMPEPRDMRLCGPIAFSAEHGIIRLAEPSDEPRVAERVFFNVGYSDQCNHLHENFYGVRNGIVETIWPILGRGKLQ